VVYGLWHKSFVSDCMNNNKNHSGKKTDPIDSKHDVEKNPDPKMDEDFPGYPHGPAKDETIKPETDSEEKTAQVDKDSSK